jgi:hypothetical protein
MNFRVKIPDEFRAEELADIIYQRIFDVLGEEAFEDNSVEVIISIKKPTRIDPIKELDFEIEKHT